MKLDKCSFTGNFEVGAIVGACYDAMGEGEYGIFNCSVGSEVKVTAVSMTITDDETSESTEMPGAYVGGIIGACSYMTLRNCTSAATVKGDDCVGGITGRLMGGLDNIDASAKEHGIIEDCEKAICKATYGNGRDRAGTAIPDR